MINIIKVKLAHASSIKALLIELGYNVNDQTLIDQINYLQDSSNDIIFCFQNGSEILGCIHITIMHRLTSPTFAEIVSLVVSEKERSKGIGKHLVSEAIEWAKDKSIQQVRVRCSFKREGAHKFYNKLGFELKKEQKVFKKSI